MIVRLTLCWRRKMNTLTIERRLNKSPLTSRFFAGVFPCDSVPVVRKFPCSFVLNVEPAAEGGSHWVAVFCTSPTSCAYFDSYGMEPNACIRNSLRQFGKISPNTHMFQAFNSNACGYYVIYFIALSSMGLRLNQIVRLLQHQRYTDSYVKEIVHRLRI